MPGPSTADAGRTIVRETPRLRLRHVELDDAAFICALLNEPSWLRFIGDRGVRSADDARRYIEDGPRRMYQQHGFGLFLIERKADGAPLGLCGLIRRDTLPDVDIGFALAAEFARHGYAYEAAAATLQYARDVQRLARVVAIVKPGNAASGRLLQRLGLQRERTIRFGPQEEELDYYGTTADFTTR